MNNSDKLIVIYYISDNLIAQVSDGNNEMVSKHQRFEIDLEVLDKDFQKLLRDNIEKVEQVDSLYTYSVHLTKPVRIISEDEQLLIDNEVFDDNILASQHPFLNSPKWVTRKNYIFDWNDLIRQFEYGELKEIPIEQNKFLKTEDLPEIIAQLINEVNDSRQQMECFLERLNKALSKLYNSFKAEQQAYYEEMRLKRLEVMKKLKEFHDTMLDWAKDFGSDHLKSGLELGYKMDGVYIQERCQVEFPGFEPELNEKYRYTKAFNPSEKAIVTLKSIQDNPYYKPEYKCEIVEVKPKNKRAANFEAVRIQGYLGKKKLSVLCPTKKLLINR